MQQNKWTGGELFNTTWKRSSRNLNGHYNASTFSTLVLSVLGLFLLPALSQNVTFSLTPLVLTRLIII